MQRAVLISALILGFLATQAHAWNSDGHMRLTQLMESAYAGSNLFTAKCWHKKKIVRNGRTVDEWVEETCIRIGSNDPDRYRSRDDEPIGNVQRQIGHYLGGNARCRAAFCAAVRAAFYGGEKDAFAVETHVPPNDRAAIAAYRLGTSFHYLQDMADPTKDILSRFNRMIIRRRMENLLLTALRQPQFLWNQIGPFDSSMTSYNLEQLLSAVDAERDQSFRILTNFLSRIFDTPPSPQIDQEIDKQVWRLSVLSVAAQRRMVVLFDYHMKARTLCDPRMNPMGYPAVIGEYQLPNTNFPPQPTAPRVPGMASDDPWSGLNRR